jgi:hypothetical protein
MNPKMANKCQDLEWFSSMHLNQVKVFKMLDQNNVTFQGFKFSFNNENAIHRYDQKELKHSIHQYWQNQIKSFSIMTQLQLLHVFF